VTPPTRVRYGVVGFAVTLAVITYIDRVCIMQSQGAIQKDLKLTDSQMAWVLSIFAWTYGLFEVPWGWLGDRIGARKILLRIVVCWSFFTAATGWTWNFASILTTRALFGAGEAGCFPNVTKAFTTWLPDSERVRAQGILWLSARWAGAFTPLLVLWVMTRVSWSRTFELFGALGVVWAFFFYRWYRDNPRDHPGLNEAERALLPRAERSVMTASGVPWRLILFSPRVWLLSLQFFMLAYGAFFYMSWLPRYIGSRGVEGSLAAILVGAPLFFAGLGSLFCGFILAWLSRRTGSPARARRLSAIVGFAGSSVLLVLATRIASPVPSLVLLGLAGFTNDLVMPPSWGAAMDLGGRSAGTVSAIMNMVGCAGAGFFPIAAVRILERSGQDWNAVIYVSAAVYFLGALCWLFLDPVTPLEPEPKEALA